MLKFLFAFFLIFHAFFMKAQVADYLSAQEKKILLTGDTSKMLDVVQITDNEGLHILKSTSNNINLQDTMLPLLLHRMFLSMTDSSNVGVGIAAPQIGINRNVIWVQRFDKKDAPFEYYLNPTILQYSKLKRQGLEGCLSIPTLRDNVYRSYSILIRYEIEPGKELIELVEGFTAVVFQHEIDHLQGILFTDRVAEQKKLKARQAALEHQLFLE